MSRRATGSPRGPAPSFGFLTETEIEIEARARRDDKRQFSARSDSFREIETVIKFTFDFGATGRTSVLHFGPKRSNWAREPLEALPNNGQSICFRLTTSYFLSKLTKALQL